MANSSRRRTRIGRALRIAGGIGLLVLAAGPFLLDAYGRSHVPTGRYDAIVVLGARVWPGGVASKGLKRRVRKAVELWKEGFAPVLLTTGGVGDHLPAESVVAARYAASLGVPETAIVTERRSQSTLQNACYAREQLPAARVLVVTDAYHALRSQLVFSYTYPVADVVGAPLGRLPPFPEALRELFALAAYAVIVPLSGGCD